MEIKILIPRVVEEFSVVSHFSRTNFANFICLSTNPSPPLHLDPQACVVPRIEQREGFRALALVAEIVVE